jgi:Xaa-Pro aminopeptidase
LISLGTGLERAGCKALLVVAHSSRDPDLAPFVRGAHLGTGLLIAPRRGRPRLGFVTPMEREEAAATGLPLLPPEALDVARWQRGGASPAAFLAATAARALQLCGLAPGRLALAGRFAAGVVRAACAELERDGWSFVDGNELVRRARRRKAAWEVEEARRAAAGAVAALRRVAALLGAAGVRRGELWLEGERLKPRRLRREIGRVLGERGLEQPEGAIVAAGSEAAVPHNQGDPERTLRAGESLVVDLFPKGLLYADCTRTLCVGEPGPALAAAHAAVETALRRARAAARPGVRAWSLQEAACRLLARRGYATPITHPGTTIGYVHGLGHGVGHELHEYPSFRPEAGADGVLERGDLFTLEPGLYDPAAGWGVRLEDLLRMGRTASEPLTPLPYALDPRAWV